MLHIGAVAEIGSGIITLCKKIIILWGKKCFSYPAHVYELKVQLNQCLMDFAQINQLDCIVILWVVFNVFPVLKINLYLFC